MQPNPCDQCAINGPAQRCSQKCIPLLRCRTFHDSRTPRVDHRMAVNAWSARIAKRATPQ
eukprot:11175814-Lingulodinium_polyedra.AAC.1